MRILSCDVFDALCTAAQPESRPRNIRHRIIGGSEVKTNRLPFLAVFTFNRIRNPDMTPVVTCTASLISHYWLVSASHCLGKKSALGPQKCISGARCGTTKLNDFVFYPDEVTSFIRIGLGNVNKEAATMPVYEVDKIIRPDKAYPTAGYGDYGGYDIILIKLKTPVKNPVPICLPTADYKDHGIKAVVAGYGKVKRATCEVTSQGPSKFRYCGVEKACQKNEAKFKQADCDVSFVYNGQTLKGCQRDKPSPSASDPICKMFLSKKSDEFKQWPNVDQFEVYDKISLKMLAKCYRAMDDDKLGWCGVNLSDDVANPKFDVKPDSGWGFCSKECYPDDMTPFFGVARQKMIDILDENFCEDDLTDKGEKTFKVKPEVLCVALNRTSSIRAYFKDESDNFQYMSPEDEQYGQLQRGDKEHFVVGPGSCHGDSGGPVFFNPTERRHIRILLGVTSSGTSKIGNCGGINNPTHYTRIKKLLGFIAQYVDDPENLCFADGRKAANLQEEKSSAPGAGQDYQIDDDSDQDGSGQSEDAEAVQVSLTGSEEKLMEDYVSNENQD